jgi:hypothetical protein
MKAMSEDAQLLAHLCPFLKKRRFSPLIYKWRRNTPVDQSHGETYEFKYEISKAAIAGSEKANR